MPVPIAPAGNELADFLVGFLQEKDQRVRAEELVSAAAAIVGERCIEAAGDFDPRDHEFQPGERIFSDQVNELITGNVDALAEVPVGSIVAILRVLLIGKGYQLADFPQLGDVFTGFAAKIGGPDDTFGAAPLSVPEAHRPDYLPLQVEFETRKEVDRILEKIPGKQQRLEAAVFALAKVLVLVKEVLNPPIALLLALETVNALAKTAPMTHRIWSELAKEAKSAAAAKAKADRPWWRFW